MRREIDPNIRLVVYPDGPISIERILDEREITIVLSSDDWTELMGICRAIEDGEKRVLESDAIQVLVKREDDGVILVQNEDKMHLTEQKIDELHRNVRSLRLMYAMQKSNLNI